MMGFWDAGASAGPHANNRHYTQTEPHQQLIFTGWMLILMPNNSVKALKPIFYSVLMETTRVT